MDFFLENQITIFIADTINDNSLSLSNIQFIFTFPDVSKIQTTQFNNFSTGANRNIRLELLTKFYIHNNPSSFHPRAPHLAGAQSIFVEPGFSLVWGKKSKVTQGEVVYPGQLQFLGWKPEKGAIDFCSLLLKCSNAPSEYCSHWKDHLPGWLCSLRASAVNWEAD